MKLPKIFVPDNLREKDIKKLGIPEGFKVIVHKPKKTKGFKTRKYTPTLESLLPAKRFFNTDDFEYIVSENFPQSYIAKWYDGNVFGKLGINDKVIEKKLAITCGNQLVMLFQYRTDKDLTNNLKGLFEKGIAHYNNMYIIGFIDRFLLKDNISVYLDCNPKLTGDLAKYYKKIGFKQIDYKLRKA